MDKQVRKKLCEAHMHRYVEVKLADGSSYNGIVEHVDDYWVYLAVPNTAAQPARVFFPGPFDGFGGFYPDPRRFARLVLPLAALLTMSKLHYYG